MSTSLIVSYCRVSTELQGSDGLGMAAQRSAVEAYAARTGMRIASSFEDVETGRRDSLENRPGLRAAVAHAKRLKALLVIARLDRLSRSVFVTSQLLKSGVEFVACDNPHANHLTIHILAAMAEYEGKLISERTKAGLAAAKARGIKVGNPRNFTPAERELSARRAAESHRRRAHEAYADLVPLVVRHRAAGATMIGCARLLNAEGHTTTRGGPWSIATIRRFLFREGMSIETPSYKRNVDREALRRAALRGAELTRERTAIAYREMLPEILRRVNDGEFATTIARDFNARGLRTQTGSILTAATVRNLARRLGAPAPTEKRFSIGTGPQHALGVQVAMARRKAKTERFRRSVLPLAVELLQRGLTYEAAAADLNRRRVKTARGERWTSANVWSFVNRVPWSGIPRMTIKNDARKFGNGLPILKSM